MDWLPITPAGHTSAKLRCTRLRVNLCPADMDWLPITSAGHTSAKLRCTRLLVNLCPADICSLPSHLPGTPAQSCGVPGYGLIYVLRTWIGCLSHQPGTPPQSCGVPGYWLIYVLRTFVRCHPICRAHLRRAAVYPVTG